VEEESDSGLHFTLAVVANNRRVLELLGAERTELHFVATLSRSPPSRFPQPSARHPGVQKHRVRTPASSKTTGRIGASPTQPFV
jgi:hypothetical protein